MGRRKTSYGKKKYRDPLNRRTLRKRRMHRSTSKIYGQQVRSSRMETDSAWQKRGYLFFVVIFVAIVVYLFFYSPVFAIEGLVVPEAANVPSARVKEVLNEELNKSFLGILPKRNIFIFSENKVKKDVLNKIPQLEDITLTRRLPDVLKVELKEKTPSAIWMSGGVPYFVDDEGIIAYQVPLQLVRTATVPIIKDRLNKEVEANTLVMDKTSLLLATELNSKFEARNGIKIHSFSVPAKGAEEVHVVTEAGWYVYFSTARSADAQLNDLVLSLREQIKSTNNLEYIDLRVTDKVYYK
ncbi:MAG: FtsQ-type POTRA domain-containing protein [bacterium]